MPRTFLNAVALALVCCAGLSVSAQEYSSKPVRFVVPYSLGGSSDVPAHSVKELIALAKAQPGKLSFGSRGVASRVGIVGEVFTSIAQGNIVHVP